MQLNDRNDLKEKQQRYITDTLLCVETVRQFCVGSSDWLQRRTQEQKELKELQQKFQKSEDESRADLEELSQILSSTRRGIEEMRQFVEAVEKLAVTSRHMFRNNALLVLPEGGASKLQAYITAAGTVCPHLIVFKRDFSVLFSPSPHNVHV